MYSNDTTQIENGLSNYIGALLKAVPYEGKAAKQLVNALLVKQSLNLAKNEKGHIDLYTFKPNLRSMKIYLEDRNKQLEALPKDKVSIELIEKNNELIAALDTLIKNIIE